jgi:hypothetical protein
MVGQAIPPLTGPESAPAPQLLTNSELGSRWLREQSKLVRRKVAAPSMRRYESDEESLGSDESSLGDLSLVRDARGSMSFHLHDCPAELELMIRVLLFLRECRYYLASYSLGCLACTTSTWS